MPLDDVRRLVAIEEIKRVRARYWNGVDRHDPALLRSVFTDEVEIVFGSKAESPDAPFRFTDPDAFVARVIHPDVQSVHQGRNPEIDILSEDEATGVWSLEDRLWVTNPASDLPFRTLHGWGHYHDRYRRTPQGWRIAGFTLVRSRADITV